MKRIEPRFVLAVSSATILSLGVTFLAVYQVVTSTEERQFDHAIRESAMQTAAHLDFQGPSRPEAAKGALPRRLAPILPVVALYPPEGPPISYSAIPLPLPPRERIRRAGDRCFDLRAGAIRLRAAVVDVPGRPGAHLLYSASPEELEVEEEFLREAMVVALLLSFVWSVGVTTYLVRRFAHGVDLLGEVVRRVAEGDLSVRVPPFEGDPYVERLSDDIDEMIGRLDVLVRSQHEFIAHAAHELRSPLTTLYGELSLALRKPREAEEYQRAIHEAIDSTRRLIALAEELLALARIADSSAPTHDVVAVDAVVSDAVRAVRGPMRERGLVVRTRGDGATVRGRHSDLVRLLRNLLENAIRHSPDRGVVEVTVEVKDHDVLVHVVDDGPGIPEVDRDRVFEPFFRGADVRARDEPGAGLGLAIVRGIARAHGGDVRLRPSDRGAHFEIRLPIERGVG